MGAVKVRATTQRVSVLSAAFFLALTILSVELIPVYLFTFEAELRGQCTPGSISPPNIPYTGSPVIDNELCFMVSFFHIALDHPLASEFLVYFIGTSSIYVILPLLEELRATKIPKPSIWRRMLRYPVGWLALSQVASLGVTMCLYGLVFSVASSASELPAPKNKLEREGNAKVGKSEEGGEPSVQGELPYIGASRLDVETVAVATLVGAALPSWALFAYREPSKTVLWQAFPLYIFVARVGYRGVIKATSHSITSTSKTPPPRSHGPQPTCSHDGYDATRLLLLSSFSVSTYFHLLFLSSMFSHPDASALWTLLSPKSPSNIALASADALSINVLIFLFWDFVFAFVSTFAALGFDALRDGEGVMYWVPTLVGCGLGCVVVGPGAMLAICVLGREERLRHAVVRLR